MKIDNQSIMITGCNRGIGLAFAQSLARRKAHIHRVIRGADADGEKQLLSLGARSVTTWICDLSQSSNIDMLLGKFKTAGFTPDVLINNAGLLTGGLLENQAFDQIQQMLQVNLLALIQLTQGLLPGMLKRGSGVIVNNASVSGRIFLPCASTYAAAKAGVVGFTESLRYELKGTGVKTLLLLTPGVKTEMFDDIAGLYGDHLDTSLLSAIPASEWAERVARAMESGQSVCLPTGTTRIGLMFASVLPRLLKFSR